MIVAGKEDGPTVLFSACSHGDEYEGAEGIIRTFNNLDPAKMKGNFVGVPAVNLGAFSDMSRYCKMDFVPVDLNRSYPGNPVGTVTLSVGNYYIENIVKKCDAPVTMHGGGNYLYLDPVVLYQNYGDDISKRSKEMAEAFGFEALWQNNVCEVANGIEDEVVYSYGIPAVTAEIGGQSSRIASKRAENIDRTHKGMVNVLRVWGIIDEEVEKFDNQYHVELEYLFVKNGGFCTPLKNGGDKVAEGETLAVISDIFGETVEELKAPYDGKVVGYWAYSICQPSSWVYMYGKEV